MKRFSLVFMILFSLFPLFPANSSTTLLTLKYQAAAIGEISLAYRLENLTMSLAAAKAVDNEYIKAILDETDATLRNGRSIIMAKNTDPDALTKEIIAAFDQLLKCSDSIKKYSLSAAKKTADEVSGCMELSRKKLELVSEMFNKNQEAGKDKKKQR